MVFLQEPKHGLTETQSLWAPALGYQLERHQWHTGRNWSIWHQGETWGAVFSQTERRAEVTVPFLNLPPNRATELAGWCHTWDSINLVNTICPSLQIPWDTVPPSLWVHPSDFSIWMAGFGSCFATSLILKLAIMASLSHQSPYFLLSGPRPGTSSSQPRFTACLCLGISKPSTSSTHLWLLYSSCRVVLGRTQGDGWPWHLPPRKPQRLHTQWIGTDVLEAPSLCPCTADPPQRAQVGGHWSQPVLAADWPG